jgi:hypothetical protein
VADPENIKRPRKRRAKVSAGPVTAELEAENAALRAELETQRQILAALRPRPETNAERVERKRLRMTTV